MVTQEINIVFTPEGVPYPEVNNAIVINARVAAVPANIANEIANVQLDIDSRYTQIQSWHSELTNWNYDFDTSVNAAIATVLQDSADALTDIGNARATALSDINSNATTQTTSYLALSATKEAALATLASDAETTVNDALASITGSSTSINSAASTALSDISTLSTTKLNEINTATAGFSGLNTTATTDFSNLVTSANSTISAAQTSATNAITSSRNSATSAISSAQTTAVSAVSTQQSTSVAAVTSAQTTATTAVVAAQTSAVATVNSTRDTAVTTVNAAGDTKLSAINGAIENFGGLNYQGAWDASTNTPALASGVGTKGTIYRVSASGDTVLDGFTGWQVEDWALFNGVSWQRVPKSYGAGVAFQGEWNAATNTPALASGVGTKGNFYRVAYGGTTNIDGTTSWQAGDWIIYSGVKWVRVSATTQIELLSFTAVTVTPSNPPVGGMNTYQKGSKFVIQYNDAGTIRYKWLNMAGTGVTWSYSTVAP